MMTLKLMMKAAWSFCLIALIGLLFLLVPERMAIYHVIKQNFDKIKKEKPKRRTGVTFNVLEVEAIVQTGHDRERTESVYSISAINVRHR